MDQLSLCSSTTSRFLLNLVSGKRKGKSGEKVKCGGDLFVFYRVSFLYFTLCTVVSNLSKSQLKLPPPLPFIPLSTPQTFFLILSPTPPLSFFHSFVFFPYLPSIKRPFILLLLRSIPLYHPLLLYPPPLVLFSFLFPISIHPFFPFLAFDYVLFSPPHFSFLPFLNIFLTIISLFPFIFVITSSFVPFIFLSFYTSLPYYSVPILYPFLSHFFYFIYLFSHFILSSLIILFLSFIHFFPISSSSFIFSQSIIFSFLHIFLLVQLQFLFLKFSRTFISLLFSCFFPTHHFPRF